MFYMTTCLMFLVGSQEIGSYFFIIFDRYLFGLHPLCFTTQYVYCPLGGDCTDLEEG